MLIKLNEKVYVNPRMVTSINFEPERGKVYVYICGEPDPYAFDAQEMDIEKAAKRINRGEKAVELVEGPYEFRCD